MTHRIKIVLKQDRHVAYLYVSDDDLNVVVKMLGLSEEIEDDIIIEPLAAWLPPVVQENKVTHIDVKQQRRSVMGHIHVYNVPVTLGSTCNNCGELITRGEFNRLRDET